MDASRLVIHAGAGSVPSAEAAPQYGSAARRGLRDALEAGHAVLRRRGAALEAVVEAVAVLEDCEVFNAGRGSVLNCEGDAEMDAAVMNGADRRAGGVTCVRHLVNPVRAALAVDQQNQHVLMAAEGAEALAREAHLDSAAASHFITEFRRKQLARARAGGRIALDHDAGGTVGAVARDGAGHLAAATSTGGISNKHAGRVSDSCQIGAGTWADDKTCAVSGTGRGEFFIRCAFAHEVDALMRHRGLDIAAACTRALEEVAALGGEGGCIAIDAAGRAAATFGTAGMPRGHVGADGVKHLAVHPEDNMEI